MKHTLYKVLFSFALILTMCTGKAIAQTDSLLDELEVEEPVNEKIDYTFKDQRLINFHTVEVGGKRTLDFRISHRFGNISGGTETFFGIDGPASIRLGLEYSYDGRLQFGIGRSNVNKLIDGFIKYRLLWQRKDNSMPVSVTLFSGMNLAGVRNDPYNQRLDYFTSRLNFVHQLMVARKFNDVFSMQINPMFIHFNLVDSISDKNDLFALPILARFKFNRRMAITAEYGLRLTKYQAATFTSEDPFTNSASLGFEMETGGHVFSIHLSNSFGVNESQTIPYTRDKWTDGDIKIGFNISRVFRL